MFLLYFVVRFAVILSFFIAIVLLPLESSALIKRRKAQFLKDPAYLILPMPYSYPGVGNGMILSGLISNMLESYTDIFMVSVSGDASGVVAGLMDLHLVPETVYFELFYSDVSAQIQNYRIRGIGTDKDDYQILNVDRRTVLTADLILSLFDRRFEIVLEREQEEVSIDRVFTPEGDLLLQFDQPYRTKTSEDLLLVTLDFTDDYQDPRKGVRLKYRHKMVPRDNPKNAEYIVVDRSASIYLPVGLHSTWAFNFQLSEAIVSMKGDTDPENIIQDLGLGCVSYDQCSQTEKTLVDSYIIQRTRGVASTLGGIDRLRAYPTDRFKGAYMAYFSTEFRWNIVTQAVPIDIWIWKDLTTSIQVAFFHEIGSVAENRDDVGRHSRTSSGMGIRLISASGVVYRGDIAFGDEGQETTIMFTYPW